ncbi:MAG: hypothetical protein Kow0075_17380 [Salibacteraceae bacterium]
MRVMVAAAALMCCFACRNQSGDDGFDSGKNYLPLSVGNWQEFLIDSIFIDDFSQSSETTSFWVRYTVSDTFIDLEGRTAYQVLVEKRYSDTASYRPNHQFAVVVDGFRAEVDKFSMRTVALVFPPASGKTWDANAFNAFPEQLFRYDYVDKATAVGALSFDSTLRVLQTVDTANFVEKSYAEERYARSVGLIYREQYHIVRKLQADSGFHLIQRIVGYSQ